MGGMHRGERDLALARQHRLLALQLLGGACASRQVLDHLARQRRRRGGPGVGQEIDEQALGRHHRIHPHVLADRHAHAHAVGIATGGADIRGRVGRQLVDRNVHRGLERDHQHVVGEAHIGVDLVGEAEDEARIAAAEVDLDLALDGCFGACRIGAERTEREGRSRQGGANGRAQPPPDRRSAARIGLVVWGLWLAHDAFCALVRAQITKARLRRTP